MSEDKLEKVSKKTGKGNQRMLNENFEYMFDMMTKKGLVQTSENMSDKVVSWISDGMVDWRSEVVLRLMVGSMTDRRHEEALMKLFSKKSVKVIPQ